MELAKNKKFRKDDNIAYCIVCPEYRDCNSHRKSEIHQKRLKYKLHKLKLVLSQKVKKAVILHDEQWKDKSALRFCHCCEKSHFEHHRDDEVFIESLACLYHHASSDHFESVKSFLKRNFRKEKPERYCISKADLDSFLEKLPAAKRNYFKKKDMLNDLVLKQIKGSEEERKKLVRNQLQEQASTSYEVQSTALSSDSKKMK